MVNRWFFKNKIRFWRNRIRIWKCSKIRRICRRRKFCRFSGLNIDDKRLIIRITGILENWWRKNVRRSRMGSPRFKGKKRLMKNDISRNKACFSLKINLEFKR